VDRGIALSFCDLDARRGVWSASRPCHFNPGKKTRYLLYRRLGGPQGRSGRVRKISPLPGIFFNASFVRILYFFVLVLDLGPLGRGDHLSVLSLV
jgi:hypothetical protein